MLVQTTRRSYTFALSAFQAVGIGDVRLTYRVRFRYPDDEARAMEAQMQAAAEKAAREARTTVGMPSALASGIDPTMALAGRTRLPSQWNFRYSFKGSRVAAPIQILDDGEFTYVRFAHYDNVPAVFVVDAQKNETLANFRREGEWLVIEKIARQLVFRANNNGDIACVFNDAYPQRPATALPVR